MPKAENSGFTAGFDYSLSPKGVCLKGLWLFAFYVGILKTNDILDAMQNRYKKRYILGHFTSLIAKGAFSFMTIKCTLIVCRLIVCFGV